MMGYAETAADLARGPELTELRTGDLARQADDGLWEIVGRRQPLRQGLRAAHRPRRRRAPPGRTRSPCGRRGPRRPDLGLHTRARVAARINALVTALTGLPAGAVAVHRLERLSRTTTGKPDRRCLERHAGLLADRDERLTLAAEPARIRDLYAAVLGRPDATTDDTFVDLGGDSLSYVEVSARLGGRLGHAASALAPTHTSPAGGRRGPGKAWATSRAGGHHSAAASRRDHDGRRQPRRPRAGPRRRPRVAGGRRLQPRTVPARHRRSLRPGSAACWRPSPRSRSRRWLWIAASGVVTGSYRPATALLLNGVLGGDAWTDDWRFWFVEALVWIYLGGAVLLGVPALDRWQRRWPFGAALVVLGVAVLARFAITGIEAGATGRYSTALVLWCFALGWAAATAHTTRQRLSWSAYSRCVHDRLLRRHPTRGRRRSASSPCSGGVRRDFLRRQPSWYVWWHPPHCGSTSPTGRSIQGSRAPDTLSWRSSRRSSSASRRGERGSSSAVVRSLASAARENCLPIAADR